MGVEVMHGYAAALPGNKVDSTDMDVRLRGDGCVDIYGIGDYGTVNVTLTAPQALWLAEQILSALYERDGACPTVRVRKES